VTLFPCPHLGGDVELTPERERHIAERHPDLVPGHLERISQTLAAPDHVRRSRRFGSALLFAKWFSSLRGGKYVVVVVVADPAPAERRWIVTAYSSTRLAGDHDL